MIVSLTGPTSLYPGETGTYTATVDGGEPPFVYKWYRRWLNSNTFTLLHTSTSSSRDDVLQVAMPYSNPRDFQLKTTVSGSAGNNGYDITNVVIDVSGGDDCPWYDPCDCPPGQICEASTDSTLTYGLGTALPEEFSLQGNAPNPFSDRTEIHFVLPKAARVMLVVYDVQGRVVARLVNQKLPAGYHRATLDASELASGIYFYRFTAGERFTDTGRMVVVQ